MKRRSDYHVCSIFAAVLSAMLAADAADAGRPEPSRPQGRDAGSPLVRPISVIWSGVPLGDALNRLAKTQDVAIWLDRRVDPGRRISLAARDEPLVGVLARLAGSEGLGISQFQSVIYLGPPQAAARLRTLGALRRQDAKKLPSGAARPFLRQQPMQWDDLASPRELLTGLAEDNGLQIRGLECVAHDLWPGRSLPPLTLADRLTLLLAPLDLTFQIEDGGKTVRVLPLPDHVALTRSYSARLRPEDAGLPLEEIARRWSRIIPERRIRVEGDHIVVEGTVEDHQQLHGYAHHANRRPPPAKKPREGGIDLLRIERVKFVDQPLVPVVRHLAAQLKLDLRLDLDALRRRGIDPNRRISVELEDVTVDELFQAVLQPAGLTFRREGSMIEIRPAAR